MAAPSSVIVPATAKHTATVIMAHGLGDSGHGWVDIAKNWRRRGKFDEVAFIFPNAPSIPITINMGVKMPGWYDIVRPRALTTFSDLQSAHDVPGIRKSVTSIHALITQAATEVPANRIVLGGFSQGGSIALLSGLSYPQKLGGVFGLSSYLLLGEKFKDEIPKENANAKTKVFMGHGNQDAVVQYEWGQRTKKSLEGWGWDVEFKTYFDMGHSACPEEISDLENFIAGRLKETETEGSASQS